MKDPVPGWQAPLRVQRFHPSDPKFNAMLPPQPFKVWWETPLVEGSNRKQFSRKNLVLIMANQDGGAHVDPGLDVDYAALCIDPLGVEIEIGGVDRTTDSTWVPPPVANNVAFASVRQIAFEVMATLHEHLASKA